jgi:putative copper export protein
MAEPAAAASPQDTVAARDDGPSHAATRSRTPAQRAFLLLLLVAEMAWIGGLIALVVLLR